MNLDRGFVADNLEQQYQALLARYNPNQYAVGTGDYNRLFDKAQKIECANWILQQISSCYVISKTNLVLKRKK